MENAIKLPADVAEHLVIAARYLDARAKRLDRLLAIYGEGEQDDPENDWEWDVRIGHSEVEKLASSLTQIAELADFLSKFGGAE